MNARRGFLAAGSGLLSAFWLREAAGAAPSSQLTAVLQRYTNGAPMRQGRVRLEIPLLVDNGNSVPLTVSVHSPMTDADYVRSIAIFNEKNPQPDVARFQLSPASGSARVSTRIRLASSQKLVAVATLSDGSYWSDTVDVVVTLASCLEE